MNLLKKKLKFLKLALPYYAYKTFEFATSSINLWFYYIIAFLILFVSTNDQYIEILSLSSYDNFTNFIWRFTAIVLFILYFDNIFTYLPKDFRESVNKGFTITVNRLDNNENFSKYLPQFFSDLNLNDDDLSSLIRKLNFYRPIFKAVLNFMELILNHLVAHIETTLLLAILSFPLYKLFYLKISFFSFFIVTIIAVNVLWRFKFESIKFILLTISTILSLLVAFIFIHSDTFMNGSSPFILNLFFICSILFYKFLNFLPFSIQTSIITLIIYTSLCSINNDNTQIESTKIGVTFKSLDEHFHQFILSKKPISGDTIPLIIVAAEGGGIRGACWTWLSLRELEKQNSNFRNSFFAFSGVSGGSVGCSLYTSSYYDNLSDHTVKKVLSFDHLSKVTGSLLLKTPIQKVLPFPIKSFDRNYLLENSFSSTLQHYTGNVDLNSYPTHLYLEDKYSRPAIFFNCTVAETGQKAIYTTLTINSEKQYFKNAINISMLMDSSDIRLKSAAILSARFPGISSGALVSGSKGSVHITDGGYIDNTGLDTAIEIINYLHSYIQQYKNKNIEIKPYIVYLKNSDPYSEDQLPKPYTFLHESRQFFGSFFNSWSHSSLSKENLYTELLNKTNISFITLPLLEIPTSGHNPVKRKKFPLGWYISDKKVSEIQQRAWQVTSPFLNKDTTLLSLYKELDSL